MSAERAIHEFWGGYFPLASLIPIDRVYTGLPPIDDEQPDEIFPPYVSLNVEGETEIERTSEGLRISKELVRFLIVSTSYDQARQIEKAITTAFDRQSFRWSDGSVLDMKPDNRTEMQNPDSPFPIWQITRMFNVRITLQESAGVP